MTLKQFLLHGFKDPVYGDALAPSHCIVDPRLVLLALTGSGIAAGATAVATACSAAPVSGPVAAAGGALIGASGTAIATQIADK